MLTVISIEELRTRSLWDLRAMEAALRWLLAHLDPSDPDLPIVRDTHWNVLQALHERRIEWRP